MIRRLVMLAAVATLAACGDGGVAPVPGQLQVQLSGPDTKAVMLRVVGPQTGVVPQGGAQMHVEDEGIDSLIIILVAPAGSNLPSGTALRIDVSDVNQVSRYTVSVLQAVVPASYAMYGPGTVTAAVIR